MWIILLKTKLVSYITYIIAFFVVVGMPIELYGECQNKCFLQWYKALKIFLDSEKGGDSNGVWIKFIAWSIQKLLMWVSVSLQSE